MFIEVVCSFLFLSEIITSFLLSVTPSKPSQAHTPSTALFQLIFSSVHGIQSPRKAFDWISSLDLHSTIWKLLFKRHYLHLGDLTNQWASFLAFVHRFCEILTQTQKLWNLMNPGGSCWSTVKGGSSNYFVLFLSFVKKLRKVTGTLARGSS